MDILALKRCFGYHSHMEIKRKRAKQVYDNRFDRFGVYVWQMPNGAIVKNEHNEPMYIYAEFGDIKRQNQLRDAAKSFGITDGGPLFLPGHRPVTDDEYEEQKERLKQGLIPDEYDLSAIAEDLEKK